MWRVWRKLVLSLEGIFKQYKQDYNKSCFKQKNTAWKTPKRVNWATSQLIKISCISNTFSCSSISYSTTCCSSTHARQKESELDPDSQRLWLWPAQTGYSCLLKLVVTSSNQFLLVQTGFHWLWMSREDGSNWLWTGSSLLLKLAVTSSNWLLKLILPGSNWFSLGVNVKRRWFKLVLPCCWNWLWPNWFILVLVHDKQIHIYGERWLKLVLPFCSSTIWCWQLGWLWLVQSGPHFATLLHWLAQTGSYWLLCMTSKFIFMEEVFSLPPARNYQVLSKSFMADQAALNMTDVKQKLIQTQKKTAEHCNKCHAVRALPPLQRVLIQHNKGN